MKSDRQDAILSILSEKEIETQNQLLSELAARGVKTTQATLSRDIRDLHLVKEMSPHGVYCYTVGTRESVFDHDSRLKKIFRESVADYAVAQHIIVIKTLPGLANAACSTLDGMDIPHLVGTLAGDDTAFLAMKDNAAAERFCSEIEKLL